MSNHDAAPDLDLIDAEPDEDDETAPTVRALQLRHPGLPVTLAQMAARGGAAIEILETRVLLLETARKRALRLTSPRDWTLNMAANGAVTCYLEDAGCHRVRDVIGVEIFDVGKPEKIAAADGQSFTYFVAGSGRSTFTRQTIERVEGGRSSDEDFFTRQKLTGAVLELKVRKAARANLNGTICRELTGLKNVALEELVDAWQGTTKTPALCNKGHGFGSQDERFGGTRASDPDVPPPTCSVCAPVNGHPVQLKIRSGTNGRPDFYGCPHYSKHPPGSPSVIIDVPKWVAQQKKAPAATAPAAPPPADDFGSHRQRGDRDPGADR